MSHARTPGPARPRRARRLALLAAAPLALAALAGCSGGDDDATAASPQEVVDGARDLLDETSGLTITLTTDALPDGVTGVTSATGEAAHPPAFDGSFDLSVRGFPAAVDVIAVDGTTYARSGLLLPDWTEIDPAEYGAPDPTALLTPGQGFSGLVGSVQDLAEGEQVRGGADNREVLTSYTGTVPGTAMAGVIPSATGDFDVELLVAGSGELREVQATGVFYDGSPASTYVIGLDDYGSTPEITAP